MIPQMLVPKLIFKFNGGGCCLDEVNHFHKAATSSTSENKWDDLANIDMAHTDLLWSGNTVANIWWDYWSSQLSPYHERRYALWNYDNREIVKIFNSQNVLTIDNNVTNFSQKYILNKSKSPGYKPGKDDWFTSVH